MKRYEYNVYPFYEMDFTESGRTIRVPITDSLESFLNEMGAEGWNLITVIEGNLIFSRKFNWRRRNEDGKDSDF